MEVVGNTLKIPGELEICDIFSASLTPAQQNAIRVIKIIFFAVYIDKFLPCRLLHF